jgi:uncharacterized protein YjgD (DUF1641 family)
MAAPLPLFKPRRDPRGDLLRQLENAPQEHAEALLDAYTILQQLRDKGLLEIAKGALGSGEKVLGILTETMETAEAVRTVRNSVILSKIVAALDPEVLENIVSAVTNTLVEKRTGKPPGLVSLLRQFSSPDTRRALAVMATMVESLGKNLSAEKGPADHGRREKITRHEA